MTDYRFKTSDGSDALLIDADTVLVNGNRHRITDPSLSFGVDAREVDKIIDNKEGKKEFISGQLGGEAQKKAVFEIIKQGNFTTPKISNKLDAYERNLTPFSNPEGEDLATTLISRGIFGVKPDTPQEILNTKYETELLDALFGKDNPYESQKLDVTRAKGPLIFKDVAVNEASFIPEFHSDVMFRDPNRTLDNKAIGILGGAGTAWRSGWQGIREGFFGYIDAIGQTTGVEMIENIGERGVRRAKDQMKRNPEILISLNDVENTFQYFPWLLNNAAASAPYMIYTLGMAAAAVPIGALTGSTILGTAAATLPVSVIYAGHTWNEMEGVKGAEQFAAASGAGVAIATLERAGIKGLISPETILSKGGIAKAAKAYREKNNFIMTQKEAEQYIASIARREQASFLKTITSLDPEDIVKFSLAQVAKKGGVASAREALTEFGQEGVQALTAYTFSDKEYTKEELKERFINAAAAGGALGFGFGSAGNVYAQGKTQLTLRDSFNFDKDRLNRIEQQKIEDQGAMNKEAIANNEKPKTINTIEENINEKDQNFETAQLTRGTRTSDKVEFRNTIINESSVGKDINLFKPNGTSIIARVISVAVDKATAIVKLRNNETYTINTNKGNPEKGIASVINPKDLNYSLITETGSRKPFDMTMADIDSLIQKKTSQLKQTKKASEKYNLNLDLTSLKHFKLDKERASGVKPGGPIQQIVRKGYTGKGDESFLMVNAAATHQNEKRGIVNFLKEHDSLDKFAAGLATNLGKLWFAAERYLLDVNKLVKSKTGLDIYSRVGQSVSGVYHSGKNFRQYYDWIADQFKIPVDEVYIAKKLGFRKMNSSNALAISKLLTAFGKSGGFELYRTYKAGQISLQEVERRLYQNGFDERITITDEYLSSLNEVSDLIKKSYDIVYGEYLREYLNERGIVYNKKAPNGGQAYQIAAKEFQDKHPYDEDYWWKNRGFDYKLALKDPPKFKQFLENNTDLSERERDDLYESVAFRGANRDRSAYSLIEGTPYFPFAFSKNSNNLFNKPEFDKWSSPNIFEALNKAQIETAKYVSTTKYFGEGGRKLNELFFDLRKDVESGLITQSDYNQMAWYTKAIIDSTHGNFRRIQSPKLAAFNNFMTTWAMFAGLPLATLSSLPETAMIYFNVKDDDEWKQATGRLSRQIIGSFNQALDGEVNKTKKYLDRVGLREDNNTVVDRLATGERDIAYAKYHELFFRLIMIKQFTQFQRRMNAGFALDFVESSMKNLALAPQNLDANKAFLSFDFDKFSEIEMRTYTQLSDLGINIEQLYGVFNDIDEAMRSDLFEFDEVDQGSYNEKGGVDQNRPYTEWFKDPTPKERALLKAAENRNILPDSKKETLDQLENLLEIVDDNLETAIYRFVNERIQLPQAANRPLFFQDPHYQLFTQFNGFISTFTANIVPKLWNKGLRKGTMRVKYDTFVLILLMLAMGGASQWLKDQLKFGKGLTLKSNDYFDVDQYVQRALYSSGILGQGERVLDFFHPLYPDRDDTILRTVFGEAGPTARLGLTAVDATKRLLTDETADKAISDLFRLAPGIGPFTGAREVAKEATLFPFRGEADVVPNVIEDIFKSMTK